MTQLWAQANPTMMMGNVQPSGRKQRELYVGNLAVGVVNGRAWRAEAAVRQPPSSTVAKKLSASWSVQPPTGKVQLPSS